jgi:branched-chain amino acid transport system substrate-binding protein
MTTRFLLWAYNLASLGTLLFLIYLTRKNTRHQVQFLLLGAIICAAGAYFFFESKAFYVHSSAERLNRSLSATGPIQLAAVWSNDQDGFFKGVELAVDELNRNGGVAQRQENASRITRKIQIRKYLEDLSEGAESSDATQHDIAKNTDIVAVVGHSTSEQSIPASITYEYNKLLYLATNTTNPRLTSHGFKYVFRTIPDDMQFAQVLIDFCQSRNLKKILVLYPRTLHGKTFTYYFQDALREMNLKVKGEQGPLEITYTQSYAPNENNFSLLVSEVLQQKFDAIFLAGSLPQAANLIREMRNRGVEQVILGGNRLDTPDLWKMTAEQARKVFIASVFSPETVQWKTEMSRRFYQTYQSRYGIQPDYAANQGYEAVQILAQVWDKVGTTLPGTASAALRSYGGWHGLHGDYGFSLRGEVTDRKIFIKTIKDGKFRDIAQDVVDVK